MTNRLTTPVTEIIPQYADISGLFGFKGHDSYCNPQDYLGITVEGGGHA